MTEIVKPEIAWNFHENENAYKATLGGYPLTMTRNPRTGQLQGLYVFTARDEHGRDTERRMKIPLHDVATVAQARIAVRDRVLETLSKTVPDFYQEVMEAAQAESLKKYAEADERI